MEVLNEFCHRAWWMRLICGGSPVYFPGFETVFEIFVHFLVSTFWEMTGVILIFGKSMLTFRYFRNCAEKPPKYTFYVQIIILSIFSLSTRKHTLNIQIRFRKSLIQVIRSTLCTYFTSTSINNSFSMR